MTSYSIVNRTARCQNPANNNTSLQELKNFKISTWQLNEITRHKRGPDVVVTVHVFGLVWWHMLCQNELRCASEAELVPCMQQLAHTKMHAFTWNNSEEKGVLKYFVNVSCNRATAAYRTCRAEMWIHKLQSEQCTRPVCREDEERDDNGDGWNVVVVLVIGLMMWLCGGGGGGGGYMVVMWWWYNGNVVIMWWCGDDVIM